MPERELETSLNALIQRAFSAFSSPVRLSLHIPFLIRFWPVSDLKLNQKWTLIFISGQLFLFKDRNFYLGKKNSIMLR